MKLSPRESRLIKTYGITLAQYNQLLKKQGDKCAVCLKDANSFTRNLCVDHDHKSMEIRGLLCNYCNRRLIGRHRDSELLSRMSWYVSQGTGWFVPVNKKKRKKRARK